MVFARGVVLVEGDAEEYLLPVLARSAGFDLDELGITVCNVGGTNFAPYVTFLGPRGLNIPCSVLTDLDPVTGKKKSLGRPRVRRLLERLMSAKTYQKLDGKKIASTGRRHGVFLNSHTFEVDLFKAGNHEVMCEALESLSVSGVAKQRAKGWSAKPDSLNVGQFLKDIEAIGKGRFAQRVAATLSDAEVPSYIRKGVEYVADRC